MPMAAPTPCRICRQLDCQAHTRKAWESARPTTRITGRKLQRMRASLFTRQPWCVVCLAKEPFIYELATIRDHRIPLSEGGRDDETNEQPICQDCHQQKTQMESARGSHRARS